MIGKILVANHESFTNAFRYFGGSELLHIDIYQSFTNCYQCIVPIANVLPIFWQCKIKYLFLPICTNHVW